MKSNAMTNLPEKAAKARLMHAVLCAQINYHNFLYYELGEPELEDFAFDKLVKKVEELERLYPELIHPYSPTQRVNGPPYFFEAPIPLSQNKESL